jgi:uncharacterized membrane-anchored protein
MIMKNKSRNIIMNLIILVAVIAGLSFYFTVNSDWNIGTVIVIVLLSLTAGFYFWLWRKYFK